MSNLPVPKDYFSDDYVAGEVLRLDEKQVKQIEADARLKLTNALIAELSFAIDNFIISSRKPVRTIPRSKTRRTLRALKKNLDTMDAFFSDSSGPEIKDARLKIESALWFISRTEREEHRKHSEAGDIKKPLVDTGRFQIDLINLKRAVQSAMDRFEQEGQAQRNSRISGNKKEIAFDRFLEDLEAIYRRASSVRGSFIDFMLAVREAMPEKNRPRVPAGWGDAPRDRTKKSGPRK